MPRYSLNLRPIYDQADMVPWQQSLSQGIGAAIGQYANRQARQRAEENQAAQAGGTPLPAAPQPGVMDRIRGIGSSISRMLHGDQTPGVDPTTQPAPNASMPLTPNVAPPALPAVRTEGAYTDPGFTRRPMLAPDQGFNVTPGTPVPALAAPRRSATAAMNGPAPMTPAARPNAQPTTIGQAIKPYTYHGEFGDYSVDPLYGARVQAEAKDMVGHQHEEEQIQSLVNAGMDPTIARAKVLNNVVRYDEQFGMKGRGGSSLTFAQRQQLQDENNKIRLTIANLANAGRQNTAEYRQWLMRERETSDQLRADENAARGYSGEAAAVERTIPQPGVNDVIARSQPGGGAAIDAAAARAAGLRGQARALRAGNQARTAGTAPAPAAGTFTPDQTRSRALELKKQGYGKSAIYEMMKREGYNITVNP
ncbi:MAG: hypothetical protein ACRDQZ_13035 [Mycobacteriales bacterium]